MRNIKTIEKDIERTIARIKKNKDAIAKAKVRYNNAVAKCTKAGYEYTGDGKDHQHAYDTFKNWDLYNPIYTADLARESIADKERQIKGDEMQLEKLHKEKEEAEARIKAVPQALKDYSVKLTQSYITEYTFRRDWAKGEIEELKADGRWNSREYWKERNVHSIWDGQEKCVVLHTSPANISLPVPKRTLKASSKTCSTAPATTSAWLPITAVCT